MTCCMSDPFRMRYIDEKYRSATPPRVVPWKQKVDFCRDECIVFSIMSILQAHFLKNFSYWHWMKNFNTLAE